MEFDDYHLNYFASEILYHIVSFLPYKDILSISETCHYWYSLCSTQIFWRSIVRRDYGNCHGFVGYQDIIPENIVSQKDFFGNFEPKPLGIRSCVKNSGNRLKTKQLTTSQHMEELKQNTNNMNWKSIYKENTIYAHLKVLKWQKSSVDTRLWPHPLPREGHDMVLMGDYIFMWGGFVDDDKLFVLDTKAPESEMKWKKVPFCGEPPNLLLYGHSLTAVPNYSMIILFGGLTQGGYHGETNAIYILHVRARDEMDIMKEEDENNKETEENNNFPFILEWERPQYPAGPPPDKRGYHSACLSSDGNKIYFFGGISHRSCISSLAILDIPSWTFLISHQQGVATTPRMGHSSFCIGNEVWFIGGGWGRDLCRHGHDLTDLYILDCRESNIMSWRKEEIIPPEGVSLKDCVSLGRCHCSALIGNKIVFFSGSIQFSNHVSVLDIDTKRLTIPQIMGKKPEKRMSPKCVFTDGKMWIWGGYSYKRQNLGDLWFLQSVNPDLYIKEEENSEENISEEEKILRQHIGFIIENENINEARYTCPYQ